MEITSKKALLEMPQEACEGLSAKKSYASPSVKVVEFVVENGMAGSNPTQGSQTFQLTAPTRATQVPGDSHWIVEDEGWCYSSSQQ